MTLRLLRPNNQTVYFFAYMSTAMLILLTKASHMTKPDVNGTQRKGREYVWAIGKQFGFFSFKNHSNFVKSIGQALGSKSQKHNTQWLKRKENLLAHVTRHFRGGVASDPNEVLSVFPSPFSLSPPPHHCSSASFSLSWVYSPTIDSPTPCREEDHW